jgi:hypothetical protein
MGACTNGSPTSRPPGQRRDLHLRPVTTTVPHVHIARGAGCGAVVSHDSGETADTTIADLLNRRGGGRPDQERRTVANRASRDV